MAIDHKTLHICGARNIDFIDPRRLLITCERKGKAPPIRLAIDQDDLGAFIFQLIHASTTADDVFGPAANPIQIECENVQVERDATSRSVGLSLYLQGVRVRMAFPAGTARELGDEISRAASELDPPKSMN